MFSEKTGGCPKSPARQALSDVAALRARVAGLEASHDTLVARVVALERQVAPKWIEPTWKRQERKYQVVPLSLDSEAAMIVFLAWQARYGHFKRIGLKGGRKHRAKEEIGAP